MENPSCKSQMHGQTGQEIPVNHWGNFSDLRLLFADIISVHSRIMKHTHTIELGYLNLLATL